MSPLSPNVKTRMRNPRGGAMVEFVVLNITLVPLLLYAIFLMDAAYMKLDLQETVVSGVWDFSQRNTEPPGGKSGLSSPNSYDSNNGLELQATAKALRIAYADHTSAVDDGAEADQSNGYGVAERLRGNGKGGKEGHKVHHTGFGAQYTFRFKEPPSNAEEDDPEEGEDTGGDLDTQMRCFTGTYKERYKTGGQSTTMNDLAWTMDPMMRSFGKSGYNAGNEVTCESVGFIYNYIIPQEFLNDSFSEVKMSKMDRRRDQGGKGVHDWQGEGGAVDNVVAYETAAISFNTWALRNGADQGAKAASGYGAKEWNQYNGKVDKADIGARSGGLFAGSPDPKDNPFYRRVQYMYASGASAITYAAVTAASMNLMGKAGMTGEKLVGMYAAPAGAPNSLLGMPNIAGVFMTARYKPGSPGQKQDTPMGLIPIGGFGNSFLSTPYTGPNNKYQQAYNARGPYYMGCKNQENPDC
ncbi:hypothetical protein [Hyalangium rubrum]|uniref:Pilus assembly protein n=1 Tax=Hyalangium rubrum TaxID=3103134 RepID=A0ABU5HDN8_9BACT|nr:hypothetical protein [Hyalangium sp. s54d21]MDY7231247.1 hypothetical protein [Hyalangium sp. s54d21]